MIEIQNLYKYYGDRRALGPFSATIEKGEIVGLLGLNGAGKTTTLRILACDLLPTSGNVRVGGMDVVEEPHEVRKRVGYLPDTPPVYAEMRVAEYLDFAAKLRGLSGQEVKRRVGEAMELTEVMEERQTPIGALSHGYRQRVGIAQAIVHQPEFVVLDEPISGLDPVQIVEMRKLVRDLGKERTVIVSSHILSEISETCDRILVIREGKIVASGSETELSEEMARGMRLMLTLRVEGQVQDEVQEKLRGMAGVTRVESSGRPEPDLVSFAVHTEGDQREDLARGVISAGYGLVGLTRQRRELEAVFLELARDDVEPEEEVESEAPDEEGETDVEEES